MAGLNVNAPVKYNGVDVGKVRAISLDPANPERVQLLFAIERGTPIKVDTVAVLKTQGLTGIAYVELGGGAADAALLRATTPGQYPVIRTKPSLSARLENVLTTVLTKLDTTTSNIDAILSDQNRQSLSGALKDLASIAHTVAARNQSLDAALSDAATTFERTARASGELGPMLARVGRGAEAIERLGKEASPLVAGVSRSAESIEKLGNEAALASARAGRTVAAVGADVRQFSDQTLPELQRLLIELNVLSRSLRRFSEQTERNPAGLLFGRGEVSEGPGESTDSASRP